MNDNPVWSIKHRPKSIKDVVLPPDLKAVFASIAETKRMPNLLLVGDTGVGKTTVALALLEELGFDVYKVNGSLNGNIDTLRNEIADFASGVSFTGERKCVLIDEADGLNINSTQPALRAFMEDFSNNCSFVLTANYRNKIHTALQGRCAVIEFNIPKSQLPKLCMEFMGKACGILDLEGITYDKSAVAELIKMYYPNWRRVINELQRYSTTGSIDSGILANHVSTNVRELVTHMRERDYTSARKWVAASADVEPQAVFRTFFDTVSREIIPQDVPQLVILIAEYQYKSHHVADQEINTSAFIAQVMGSCSFKEG